MENGVVATTLLLLLQVAECGCDCFARDCSRFTSCGLLRLLHRPPVLQLLLRLPSWRVCKHSVQACMMPETRIYYLASFLCRFCLGSSNVCTAAVGGFSVSGSGSGASW
jgi:hypothetical protein